jgi:hypothetical protein
MTTMDVWQKQPEESAESFQAFCAFRDLDPSKRVIRHAAEELFGEKFIERDAARFGTWSAKFGWIRRSEAWDVERDRQKQEATLEEVREMGRRQVLAARTLQKIADISAERELAKLEAEDGYQLNPALILQFATQGASMERVVRGEPSEILGSVSKEVAHVQVNWGAPTHDDEPEAPAIDGDDAVDASGPDEGDRE